MLALLGCVTVVTTFVAYSGVLAIFSVGVALLLAAALTAAAAAQDRAAAAGPSAA